MCQLEVGRPARMSLINYSMDVRTEVMGAMHENLIERIFLIKD